MGHDEPPENQFRAWFHDLLPIGLIILAGVVALVALQTRPTGRYYYDIYVDPDHPCIVRATTWLDQNLNGQRDPHDIVLPGVRVTFARKTLTTNSYGRAEVSTGNGASCIGTAHSDGVGMTISAEVPPGYQPTTPLSVTITTPYGAVDFGFTYLPGVPTITPSPARP